MVTTVRMFADDYSGRALWVDSRSMYPPVPPEIQAEIDAWINDWELLHGMKEWPPDALVKHDLKGWQIARMLQLAAGPDFLIKYEFETSEGRAAAAEQESPGAVGSSE